VAAKALINSNKHSRHCQLAAFVCEHNSIRVLLILQISVDWWSRTV